MDETAAATIHIKVGDVEVDVSGTGELVEKVFLDLKEVLASRLQTAVAPPTVTPATGGANSDIPDEKVDLTAHLFWTGLAVQPKTAQEQVTMLAYYRKHHMPTPTFDEPTLAPMFNEIGVPLPEVKNALNNASRKTVGWLRLVSRGVWEITTAGENKMRLKFLEPKP